MSGGEEGESRQMQTTARNTRAQGLPGAPTEFRLKVNSADTRRELEIVQGRDGDFFVVTPDARVVAALVILDPARGLA